MGLWSWLKEKFIYLAVLILLAVLLYTVSLMQQGAIDVESAKVYVQALTAVATLALLYYAYYNVASKKEEDIARLELAVRPILVWELESKGSGAELECKTLKHPIYDLHIRMHLGAAEHSFEERHLDVSEANPHAERKYDVTKFIKEGLGSEKMSILTISFAYHSEVGGRYEFSFTKEVLRAKKGFAFQHRKIVSAKYPWKQEKVSFTD